MFSKSKKCDFSLKKYITFRNIVRAVKIARTAQLSTSERSALRLLLCVLVLSPLLAVFCGIYATAMMYERLMGFLHLSEEWAHQVLLIPAVIYGVFTAYAAADLVRDVAEMIILSKPKLLGGFVYLMRRTGIEPVNIIEYEFLFKRPLIRQIEDFLTFGVTYGTCEVDYVRGIARVVVYLDSHVGEPLRELIDTIVHETLHAVICLAEVELCRKSEAAVVALLKRRRRKRAAKQKRRRDEAQST